MAGIKYKKFILKLWKLTEKIGCQAEIDNRYADIYDKLLEALDIAEEAKLIEFKIQADK